MTTSGNTSPGACIARQQWRARIETVGLCRIRAGHEASPASNGGRGLKQVRALGILHLLGASPASNGGRGLKLDFLKNVAVLARIARQQWRARIETSWRSWASRAAAASPASNGGRGLKPWNQAGLERGGGIARQQWRARIETDRRHHGRWHRRASPASNGGRGLKRRSARPQPDRLRHRPPAMAGAD